MHMNKQKIGCKPSHSMLVLEKLLNPEVKKNVVKQVATPANMRADGLMTSGSKHTRVL